jgi:hypothetical protein
VVLLKYVSDISATHTEGALARQNGRRLRVCLDFFWYFLYQDKKYRGNKVCFLMIVANYTDKQMQTVEYAIPAFTGMMPEWLNKFCYYYCQYKRNEMNKTII